MPRACRRSARLVSLLLCVCVRVRVRACVRVVRVFVFGIYANVCLLACLFVCLFFCLFTRAVGGAIDTMIALKKEVCSPLALRPLLRVKEWLCVCTRERAFAGVPSMMRSFATCCARMRAATLRGGGVARNHCVAFGGSAVAPCAGLACVCCLVCAVSC